MATFTSPLSSAVPATAPQRRRHRYSDNVYLQDGYVVIGILSALLFLIVAVSLDAAGYVDNMTMLLPVTLGAFTLGILMSFSRFDAFFALSHSLFTGLAWILYQMTPLANQSEVAGILDKGITPLQAKSYLVLVAWMQWVSDAVTQQANEDNLVFIFEIAFLVWWLTFLGVWAIFRYGYTWRAVIPAGIVLVINAYYAPPSTLGFLALFSLVALVLLVRTNLSEQQLRWREQRTYFSPDITLDFMRNALIYSVIVLAIAWLLPGLGRSAQFRAIVMDPLLNERLEEGMERLEELYRGVSKTRTVGTATFSQSLTLQGPRNPGDAQVLQVDSLAGRYWRAVTYDTYDNGRWTNSSSTAVDFEAGDFIPAMEWSHRSPMTQTIVLQGSTGGVIFALADIRRIDVPLRGLVQSANGEILDEENAALPVEISLARSRRAGVAGDSYTVVSSYSQVTQNDLLSAGTDYPPAILERYLQLPEGFSPDVQNTAAEIAAGHETAYEKAKAIETYLREIPYNDQIAQAPDGVEPVEYFLYQIREGYCDYYATSMVVMLRSLGIPSRTASGYAEGKRNEEDGFTVLSEDDAHTWVEVYFPEYGWIEFEPTAIESVLDRPSGDEIDEEGEIPGAASEFPNDRGDDPSLYDDEFDPFAGDFSQDPSLFPESGPISSKTPWWVWALATPIVLLVGFVLLTRTRFLGPSRFTPELAPILFERMHRWADRLGLNLTQVQTPYEQAARIRRAFPEGQPYIDNITDSYVRYSFSENPTGESTITGITSGQPTIAGTENVAVAWQRLRSLFWKAWLRKTLLPRWKRKQDPYSLSRRG